MFAVIRLRGEVRTRTTVEHTLRMLGLTKKHTLVILPESASIKGMIKKTEDYVAWGTIPDDQADMFGSRVLHLSPPRKGFKTLRKRYPAGDLGYRGQEIAALITSMRENNKGAMS